MAPHAARKPVANPETRASTIKDRSSSHQEGDHRESPPKSNQEFNWFKCLEETFNPKPDHKVDLAQVNLHAIDTLAKTKQIQKPEYPLAGPITFTSVLSSSMVAPVLWSLGSTVTRGNLQRIALLATAVSASGLTGTIFKAGGQSAGLLPKDKNDGGKALAKEFALRSGDGLCALAGARADQFAGNMYKTALGFQKLGTHVSARQALEQGSFVLTQEPAKRMAFTFWRTLSGSSAASATWASLKAAPEASQKVGQGKLNELPDVGKKALGDIAIGTVFGTALSCSIRGVIDSKYFAGAIADKLKDNKNLFGLVFAHTNDIHSENLGNRGLPRLVTLLNGLKDDCHKLGKTLVPVNVGDLVNGNSSAAYTNGFVEHEIMAANGFIKNTLGNHDYNKPGGSFDIGIAVERIKQAQAKYPGYQFLCANIDKSAYPELAGLISPYKIEEVIGANGKKELIAYVGIVTDEGAVGKMIWHNPVKVLNELIPQIQKTTKNIVVLAHNGLDHDLHVLKQVKGVSLWIGAHSHDLLGTAKWVNYGSWQDRLQSWLKGDKSGLWQTPVVQTGSSLRNLGKVNLTINPDGSANRYRTKAELLPISPDVKEHLPTKEKLQEALKESEWLDLETVKVTIKNFLSVSQIRNTDNALGKLFARALRDGLQALNPDAPRIYFLPSGIVRSGGLAPCESITRRRLCDMLLNCGKPDEEVQDLLTMKVKGQQLLDMLEFGTRGLAPNQGLKRKLTDGLKNLADTPEPVIDEPGELIQPAGLQYTLDLSKALANAGSTGERRISDVLVENENGIMEALDLNKTYDLAFRHYTLNKMIRLGVFGAGTQEEIYRMLNVNKLAISPIDLLMAGLKQHPVVEIGKGILSTPTIINKTPLSIKPPLKFKASGGLSAGALSTKDD